MSPEPNIAVVTVDEPLPRRIQLRGKLGRLTASRRCGGDCVCHSLTERGQAGAVALGYLAAQQVQALDAVPSWMGLSRLSR